eukprot:358404-Chlamydomonas_euryale.AAC.18
MLSALAMNAYMHGPLTFGQACLPGFLPHRLTPTAALIFFRIKDIEEEMARTQKNKVGCMEQRRLRLSCNACDAHEPLVPHVRRMCAR